MKIISVAVLLMVSLNSFSQMRYGIKVGANFANINHNFANPDFELPTKIRLAYNIGAIIEYPLSEIITLQSGLQLTSKGYSSNFLFKRYSITYLEVPINVAYKIRDFRIIVGPYIAFGISGKTKLRGTLVYKGTVVKDVDIKFKGTLNESDFNPSITYIKGLDYGLSFGIGYNIGPMMINAGYGLGLANLTPDIEVAGFEFYAKAWKKSNSVLNLSVSYFFGK